MKRPDPPCAFDHVETLAELAGQWAVPLGGTALFAADYDDRDDRTLRLYALGKQRQWDAAAEIDWSHDVDPDNPMGMPDSFVWIAGTPLWTKLSEQDRNVIRRHTASWSCSTSLHGEQFGMLAVAKLVQTVPDLDAKMFAATQLIDEARHTEVFDRYLTEKIGMRYGVTGPLASLFEGILRESAWDFTALAVQILVENMALASFGIQRDRTCDPLVRALHTNIMKDEARHVAFGRLLLREHYRHLSPAELREREEFAVQSCWTLRELLLGEEMWRTLDYGARECVELARSSVALREFRRRLFMRVVPALKDIGLFGPIVRDGLTKLGALGFAQLDRTAIEAMDDPADDRAAAELDRREQAARRRDIEDIIALGGEAS